MFTLETILTDFLNEIEEEYMTTDPWYTHRPDVKEYIKEHWDTVNPIYICPDMTKHVTLEEISGATKDV